jgi:pimeloyl-ACP methyl ester carboxylesterase
MARLILIHGGVHGAWCWERVLEPLRAAGHQVETVDLPGRGADADRARTVTLQDWVARVSEAIDAGPTPVVLVAHSMGGLSASQVAEQRPMDIARIVYVAAVVPRDGEAGMPTLEQAAEESLIYAPGALVFSDDQALVGFTPEHVGPIFYSNSAPSDIAWATERVCLEPVAPLMTPLSLTSGGFGKVAKTYIATGQDRAVPLTLQHQMARDAGAEVLEIDSDHSPFVSAVDVLVDTVNKAVRA